MYRSFYNLKSKPFQISSDPDFMWFGEKHKEALATLKYGILDNKGFLLLTGDVGTGKTTLINALTKSLDSDIIHASVPDPSLEKIDFFNYIGSAFGIGNDFSSKGTFLAKFSNFLYQAYDEKKKVLLLIDEAQLLTQELLEEIRLLSNIERTDTKLVNIFFIGQNEFNEILNQEKNRAVRQRLTLHYIIDPLTLDETNNYIHHRLHVAGNSRRIFTPLAVREVYNYSEGFPRRINVICDHCLLTGYASGKITIDESTVQECAHELIIPKNTSKEPPPAPAPQNTQGPPTSLPQTHPQSPFEKKDKYSFLAKGTIGIAFLFVCYFFSDIFLQRILQERASYNTNYSQGFSEKQAENLLSNTPPPIEGEGDSSSIQPDRMSLVQAVRLDTAQPEKKIFIPTLKASRQITNMPYEKLEPVMEIPPMPTEPMMVHFRFNSNEFARGETERLDRFAELLTLHPGTKLFLKGYSDSGGDEKYNQPLSAFRANLVKSYLLGKGAKTDHIHVEGFGSKNPIESNSTTWGRSQNRRVEIEVLMRQKE